MSIIQGTRVEIVEKLSRPGDFCFWHISEDGQSAFMAFICPCGAPTHDGGRHHDSIPVKIGSKEDGSWAWDGNPDEPTLAPSILRTGSCGWHGYLEKGVWRSV